MLLVYDWLIGKLHESVGVHLISVTWCMYSIKIILGLISGQMRDVIDVPHISPLLSIHTFFFLIC